MPVLKNPRHEVFAQLVAKLMPAGAAYKKIYRGVKASTAETEGPALLRKPQISSRLMELQQDGAKAAIISLEKANQFCLDVLEAKVGEVDETSPLCQSFKITEDSREYKLPDKLRALEIAMKLQGRLRDRAVVEHTGEIKHTVTVTEAERTSIIDRRRAIRERIFSPS